MKFTKSLSLTIICIILGVMIALQYRSVNFNQNAMSLQSQRAEDLMQELIRVQAGNAELRNQLQKLQDEVRLYQSAKSGSDDAFNELVKQLETGKMFAGFTDVTGDGIIINVESGLYSILDTDLLALINELRAAGAQAISINNERVTALTEIRDAPPYTMINKVPMNEPFIIKAIGNPQQLENSLTLINGVVESLQDFLDISVEKAEDIVIPKVRDDDTVIKTDLLNPVQ